MGVWIEMLLVHNMPLKIQVTPCVGVWIEIDFAMFIYSPLFVTPCVGVWIEILIYQCLASSDNSHSLRGSVD